MSETHRAVVFHGNVQGVGFRWTTSRVAEKFCVRGWVRNESDGTVRCEVVGMDAEVCAFLTAVNDAMPGHVTAQNDVQPDGGSIPGSGFVIRR